MAKTIQWALFCLWIFSYKDTQVQAGTKCYEEVCMSQGSEPMFCTFGNELIIKNINFVSSDTPQKCQQGTTYTVGETGIWMTSGCRGLFRVCVEADTNLSGTRVRCDGAGQESRTCPLDPAESIYDVSLAYTLGGICTEGETYNRIGSEIIVSGGCSGIFDVQFIPDCIQITCSSHYNITAHCALPPGYSDRKISSWALNEQLSVTSCEGKVQQFITAILVTGGCKGIFNVCTTLQI
ncbi:hypothetical protein ScPMuIL_014131 [Solemya velum]